MQKNRDKLNRHIVSEKRDLRELGLQNQVATQAEAEAEARTWAEVEASATQAFSQIRTLLKGVNPLRLLSRICIQCGFYEASEAGALESYASQWASWSEIVAHLVCLGQCVISCPTDPTRETIGELSREFSDYWHALLTLDQTDRRSSTSDTMAMMAVESRMHTMMVKHDAQPYQFYEAAARLYSPEDEWLKEHLGFTVEQALATMRGIADTIEWRLQCSMEVVGQQPSEAAQGKAKVSELILSGLDRNPDLAVMTEEEIIATSNVPRSACLAVLKRFSRNIQTLPPDESLPRALDPLQFPFDFNPIHSQPLLKIGGGYVCPQLILLYEAVFLGLHFDLAADKTMLGTYGNDRGAWLERTVADSLRSVFGPEAVYANPYRDDHNELCDVLVYYDNIIIVVSCKAKMLTALAEYGNDAVRLKDDLQKGIGDSYRQIEGAIDYLRKSGTVELFHLDGTLWTSVRSAELDAIVPVYVLPSTYQNLVINTRDLLSGLQLQVGIDNVPWMVSVFDLQPVAEILDSPALFLHYVARRREMVFARTLVQATETDLIERYLNQGLYFGPGSDYSKVGFVLFDGLSAGVDFYLRDLHERRVDVGKPISRSPVLLSGLVAEIMETDAAHRTVSLLRLLDLDGTDQTTLLDHITSCREQTLVTTKPCFCRVGVKRGFTMSIITYCAAMGSASDAVEQARDWARERLEPGRRGTWEWVCFVGGVASGTRVQSVIYVPPHETRDKPL